MPVVVVIVVFLSMFTSAAGPYHTKPSNLPKSAETRHQVSSVSHLAPLSVPQVKSPAMIRIPTKDPIASPERFQTADTGFVTLTLPADKPTSSSEPAEEIDHGTSEIVSLQHLEQDPEESSSTNKTQVEEREPKPNWLKCIFCDIFHPKSECQRWRMCAYKLTAREEPPTTNEKQLEKRESKPNWLNCFFCSFLHSRPKCEKLHKCPPEVPAREESKTANEKQLEKRQRLSCSWCCLAKGCQNCKDKCNDNEVFDPNDKVKRRSLPKVADRVELISLVNTTSPAEETTGTPSSRGVLLKIREHNPVHCLDGGFWCSVCCTIHGREDCYGECDPD